MAFLDKEGLSYFLSKIEDIFASKDVFSEKSNGLVPSPGELESGDRFLKEDGTWDIIKSFDIPLDISKGGTGAEDRVSAFKNLAYLGENVSTDYFSEDTYELWKGLGTGYAYFTDRYGINSTPVFSKSLLLSIVTGSDVAQWLFPLVGDAENFYYRKNDGSNTMMPQFGSNDYNIFSSQKVITNKIYPVGSVYISYDSTSPASLFGGTWTQITGRFIRAANDVNTGGADTVAHNHLQTTGSDGGGSTIYHVPYANGNIEKMVVSSNTFVWGSDVITVKTQTTSTAPAVSSLARIEATGQRSLNNMPAYQDLYVWRRTGL